MTDGDRAPLQLGIFMPNCSNMYSISTYRQEPDEWEYDTNRKIAQAAEAAGFDFSVFRSAAGAGSAARRIFWAGRWKP